MKNKTIAQIIMGAIAVAILTAMFETSLTYTTTENLYSVAGLAMMVFGTWGSIRLYKSED